jgi:hypothetical protein
LQGNLLTVDAESISQARQQRNFGYVSADRDAKHNQTRIDNGRLLLGDVELAVPNPKPEAEPEDTVVSAGPYRLVSVSLSSQDRNDADVYVVANNHAELLDRHQPLYRKIANPDGSFWITTAHVSYEMHHTSWFEQHVWLIGKDGNIVSMNKQLGSNDLRILSVLRDGTLLVAASGDTSDEFSPATIYRIGSDGKAVKLYEAVKGSIYADQSGEVYVVSYPDQRITRLSSGTSVVLTDMMMFQASKGRPQPLHAVEKR